MACDKFQMHPFRDVTVNQLLYSGDDGFHIGPLYLNYIILYW